MKLNHHHHRGRELGQNDTQKKKQANTSEQRPVGSCKREKSPETTRKWMTHKGREEVIRVGAGGRGNRPPRSEAMATHDQLWA